MSLKAKLEAVIYAAEEPVTLSQLAALFADEALEWKAQQTAAVAAAGTFSPGGPDTSLVDPGLEYLGLEQDPEVYAEAEAEAGSAQADAGDPGANPVVEAEGGKADANAPTADPESEAKRLARQRDREVKAILRGLLDEMMATYESDGRGIEI